MQTVLKEPANFPRVLVEIIGCNFKFRLCAD